MGRLPLVSVIMNCLNCEKYVKEAIDSVYAQTYPNWEIIFWDNASTDKSAEIAESYDERLRYFRSSETVPLGKARNWALEKAKGKYIAFLDCDDVWFPKKLEKQIPLFEKNKQIGLVYSNTIFYNQNSGRIRRCYRFRYPPRGKIFRALLSDYFLSMETVVIKKESLNSLTEWFDERFNVIEEADLFIRICYHWEADYVNEPLAVWRIHDESWTWTRSELFGKELEMMIEKFQKLYPNFEIRFKKEIKRKKAKIAYWKAIMEWRKGNEKKLQNILKPYLFSDLRLLVIYVISFLLSYKQYFRLYKLLRWQV